MNPNISPTEVTELAVNSLQNHYRQEIMIVRVLGRLPDNDKPNSKSLALCRPRHPAKGAC